MSDPPPDDQRSGTPTPLTTSGQIAGITREVLIIDPISGRAYIAGVAREALILPTTTSTAFIAGLAREALISGTGLGGTASAKSRARADPLTITVTGAVLSSTATAKSTGRATIAVTMQLTGKVAAQSAGQIGQLPTFVSLGARLRANSTGQMADLSVRVIQARARTMSRARGALTLRYAGPQNAVTLNV